MGTVTTGGTGIRHAVCYPLSTVASCLRSGLKAGCCNHPGSGASSSCVASCHQGSGAPPEHVVTVDGFRCFARRLYTDSSSKLDGAQLHGEMPRQPAFRLGGGGNAGCYDTHAEEQTDRIVVSQLPRTRTAGWARRLVVQQAGLEGLLLFNRLRNHCCWRWRCSQTARTTTSFDRLRAEPVLWLAPALRAVRQTRQAAGHLRKYHNQHASVYR